MTRKTNVVFLVVIFSCLSTQAFAYLDPGTGSMIFQVIIGAVAAALVSIKLAWHKIVSTIGLVFRRRPKTEPAAKREE